MKITRNTIRADGLTVGEALDRDAAFLRSIGVDAKDGALTIGEHPAWDLPPWTKRPSLQRLNSEL